MRADDKIELFAGERKRLPAAEIAPDPCLFRKALPLAALRWRSAKSVVEPPALIRFNVQDIIRAVKWAGPSTDIEHDVCGCQQVKDALNIRLVQVRQLSRLRAFLIVNSERDSCARGRRNLS